MPTIRKIDPVEAAWNDFINWVGRSEEEIPRDVRGSARYWTFIELLKHAPNAWVDVSRANAAGYAAVHHPHLVRRLAYIKAGKKHHLYQLTHEGRQVAQRFADYEERRRRESTRQSR